jgi:hypothetical protein
MEETSKTKSGKRYWIYGGLIVLVIVIALLGKEAFWGAACAQVPCTAAKPCKINGVIYTTGSKCGRGEGSGCGYFGTCRTNIDRATNRPHCDCT